MTLYEIYQLQWMIEHGYSLEDFVKELSKELNYAKQGVDDNLLTIFHDWERECGFNSEIYCSEEEFLDNEYKEIK